MQPTAQAPAVPTLPAVADFPGSALNLECGQRLAAWHHLPFAAAFVALCCPCCAARCVIGTQCWWPWIHPMLRWACQPSQCSRPVVPRRSSTPKLPHCAHIQIQRISSASDVKPSPPPRTGELVTKTLWTKSTKPHRADLGEARDRLGHPDANNTISLIVYHSCIHFTRGLSVEQRETSLLGAALYCSLLKYISARAREQVRRVQP